MAGTAVTLFGNNKNLPAHVTGFMEEGGGNIPDKQTVPQLSYRGKVFRVVINGDETPLLDKDGDPIPSVNVVILDLNKARSRSYYEGAYVEGKSTPPVCWSSDGETPDASVQNKQSPTCGTCQWAVKGSKVTDAGKATTACATFKRMAVVPLEPVSLKAGGETSVEFEPLLLRIAQTSMWDGNNEDNESRGYYAFDQYLDMLRKNGVTHTAVVATRVKFDSRMAYPKLIFAATRFLVDSELEVVKALVKDERVPKLLKASDFVAAARTEKAATPDDDAPATPAAKPAPAKPAKAAPPSQEHDDDPPPAPTKPVKAAPAADPDDDPPPPPPPGKGAKAAAPAAAADDGDEPPPPPPSKGAKAAPNGAGKEKAKPSPAAAGALASLVGEWTGKKTAAAE